MVGVRNGPAYNKQPYLLTKRVNTHLRYYFYNTEPWPVVLTMRRKSKLLGKDKTIRVQRRFSTVG